MGEITGNGTAVNGLGGARGYGETELPRGDDSVTRINVAAVFEDGLDLGGVHYQAGDLFVSTDGLISFGSAVSGVAASAAAITAPFFAIFNADVDTRLDGEGAESGAIWLDVDAAQDCVTITWDHVGFYRRNASLTDTFQIQLFDRGNGGFEVVYRYQDISWTSGDLQGGSGGLGGTAALIGHRITATGAATLLAASGSEGAELALPAGLGNSAIAGLWQWAFLAPSQVVGTSAADTLHGTTGDDTMSGLGGNDVLMGSLRADVLNGGDGLDWANYSGAPQAVRIDLTHMASNAGFATGDSFLLIERLAGSGFGDTLLGGASGDQFIGGGGADSLAGRQGNDWLNGGADADTLAGGIGRDTLFGGAGADRLLGLTDDDYLASGAGSDQLYGGDGNDRLDGGVGFDTLTGGAGADAFEHAGIQGQGCDWVMDFANSAGDHLLFGIAGAVAADFRVTFALVAGAGQPAVAEAFVRYLPTSRLIWMLVDGADEGAILLQSSMNSFDLL